MKFAFGHLKLTRKSSVLAVLALGLSLLTHTERARAESPYIPVASEPLVARASVDTDRERFLEVTYSLKCDHLRDQNGFPGLHGSVILQKPVFGIIRFDLLAGKTQARVSLGSAHTPLDGVLKIKLPENGLCYLISYTAKIVEETTQEADLEKHLLETVQKHSPYIVVRDDQNSNRNKDPEQSLRYRQTDLPLELVYDIQSDPKAGTLTIRYTAFFSDEDSKTKARAIHEDAMNRYGRATDVEWVYKIVFDRTSGKTLSSQYQGTFFDKHSIQDLHTDHAELQSHGSFWPGTQHPIFYNVADNNVFSDRPAGKQNEDPYVAYHLVPEHQIVSPRAREAFQLSDAGSYMYLISEKEQQREKKFWASPDHYLYVGVEGTLLPSHTTLNQFNGKYQVAVDWSNPDGSTTSILNSGTVDRLGEDMFEKEAFAAIELGAERMQEILKRRARLDLRFEDAKLRGTEAFSTSHLSLLALRWSDLEMRYVPEPIQFKKHIPGRDKNSPLRGFETTLMIRPNQE